MPGEELTAQSYTAGGLECSWSRGSRVLCIRPGLGERGVVARVVVMGAGVVGLTTAMLLNRDGHEVTVVERDGAEPDGSPEALWSDWQRRGVNQFRLLHYFQPEFRARLERELPAVVEG